MEADKLLVRCAQCACERPVYQADDLSLYCRQCWANWFGTQPPPSGFVRVGIARQNFHIEELETKKVSEQKDLPWPHPWPVIDKQPAALPLAVSQTAFVQKFCRAVSSSSDVDAISTLCSQALERIARFHCDEIVCIARSFALVDTLAWEKSSKGILLNFLRVTAKRTQLCTFSGYVEFASELQIFGLAHGDGFIEERTREAVAYIEHYQDVAFAADLLWVFITAKLAEASLFKAAETTRLGEASIDALIGLLCAYACDNTASSRTVFLQKLAAVVAKRADEIPVATMARLASALDELDLDMPEVLSELSRAALRHGLAKFSLEDLVELAVATSKYASCAAFILQLAEEVQSRILRSFTPVLLAPGARVRLARAIGPFPVGAVGILGEYVLAAGRWRLWLDSGLPVDACESEVVLLDDGARPGQCCQQCWRLETTLHRGSNGAVYCLPCLEACSRDFAQTSVTVSSNLEPEGVRGCHSDLMVEDGIISGRECARLSCALALCTPLRFEEIVKKCLDSLCRIAEQIRQRSMQDKPFSGVVALAPPEHRSFSVPEVPVLVVNLDRSPHRLEDMRKEVSRCYVRARRFPATDGRHRVVRKSRTKPYARDLTDFCLRWDESRPAMGVAMTAEVERHYVGYVGSWLSHMRALRQGIDEGFPFVVALEDDQVLSPHFNAVVQDIIDCAGDTLDVVILGPLDWRLRSLQYAQKRKVMDLRLPCPEATCTDEEKYMFGLYGYDRYVAEEKSHFLYSIGCRAMGGNDYMTTGCCGVWGYLVSRKGLQKMQNCMKFMWESFDDVLQAELQGDNRFTEHVGKFRLWGIWPPIVTSDGKWPSQNSGEDLDMGRQVAPVSPHASFRDPSLQTEIASIVLGPDHTILAKTSSRDDLVTDAIMILAATVALLLSPVQPIWAYVITSWRRLFDQRHGAGHGFELRTEMQLRLHSERRFFDICTEGLTWSWTILRAAFLFGLYDHIPVVLNANPPEGPPVQLQPLCIHVIEGPGRQLAFCTDAWFCDLQAVVPGSIIEFTGRVAADARERHDSDLVSKLQRFFPRASFQRVKQCTKQHANLTVPSTCPIITVVADVQCMPKSLVDDIRSELALGAHVVMTAQTLGPLLDLLNELVERSDSKADNRKDGGNSLQIVFAGVNPFRSCLQHPVAVHAHADTNPPRPGKRAMLQNIVNRPSLNGREAFVTKQHVAKERWQVRLSGGEELSVKATNLIVQDDDPWPPAPLLAEGNISAGELWKAAREHQRAERYDDKIEEFVSRVPPSTNAFWVGLRSSLRR